MIQHRVVSPLPTRRYHVVTRLQAAGSGGDAARRCRQEQRTSVCVVLLTSLWNMSF